MAVGALTNALVLINTVDLSDHCSGIHLTDSRAAVDVTAMGALNVVVTKGLGDATATFELLQDGAAAKTHATLQALIAGTTPFPVEVRMFNAARSTTNPTYFMAGALLFEYPMLDGKIGDANNATYTFRNASQAGVAYPTS